jgi:hypothetical protein
MLANHSEFLLHSLGYEDLRPKFDGKHLLATAQQIHPEHLTHVEKSTKNFRAWEHLGSSYIIEQVYGIDYIAEISNERIAFSLTPYPNEVEEKVVKAKSLSKLWQSLDISKFVVLLAVYPSTEAGEVFYGKDGSQDELLSVIFNAIDSTEAVLSAEFHIQAE